jgi:hypothetical protein
VKPPSWKYRRRAIFGTLIFGAFIILWIVFTDDDRPVLETVVLSLAGLMGAALSVYTGAAAYEDVKLRQREVNPDGQA